MKKSLLGLLLLLTLTACGGQSTPEPPESEGIICVLAEPAPPDRDGLHIFVEREVYAPSLTTFTYFIYNHTDETVEFGEDYRIQRLADDGSWVDLTPREDWGFTCIGLILKPGGEMSGTCTLDRYEEMPAPGSFSVESRASKSAFSSSLPAFSLASMVSSTFSWASVYWLRSIS